MELPPAEVFVEVICCKGLEHLCVVIKSCLSFELEYALTPRAVKPERKDVWQACFNIVSVNLKPFVITKSNLAFRFIVIIIIIIITIIIVTIIIIVCISVTRMAAEGELHS